MTAAEFLGACIVLGREGRAVRAAEFLVRKESDAAPEIKDLAAHILRLTDRAGLADTSQAAQTDGSLHKRIRALRVRTHAEPRNALAWTDLSRAYAVIGLGDQAARCMEIALSLAPANRFVLRAAARLFVHLDDADRAHQILRRAEPTKHDPWLTAAEISVATVADRSSRLIKSAQSVLRDKSLPPNQLTELASAVGTVELYSGKRSSARSFLRQSLDDPNDNALAQATWAARHLPEFDVAHSLLSTPRSFEARAWSYFMEKRWQEALDQCQEWLFDEPFSSRPAELGSFIASFALGDHQAARRLVEGALRANPHHWGLRNNLALALVNLGQAKEAQKELDRIPQHDLDSTMRVVTRATQGLIHFRTGAFEVGRKDYAWALENSHDLHPRLRHLAAAHLAQEEVRIKSPEASAAVRQLIAVTADSNDPDIRQAVEQLEGAISSLDEPDSREVPNRPGG